jgi:hypothetical protein
MHEAANTLAAKRAILIIAAQQTLFEEPGANNCLGCSLAVTSVPAAKPIGKSFGILQFDIRNYKIFAPAPDVHGDHGRQTCRSIVPLIDNFQARLFLRHPGSAVKSLIANGGHNPMMVPIGAQRVKQAHILDGLGDSDTRLLRGADFWAVRRRWRSTHLRSEASARFHWPPAGHDNRMQSVDEGGGVRAGRLGVGFAFRPSLASETTRSI